MRVLITGGNGQLGQECRAAAPSSATTLAVDLPDFDLLDAEGVRRTVETFRPTVIFHLAAWTAVDRAEEHPEAAFRVNRDGTRNLARAAADLAARLIYISTDYVYSGISPGRPWRESDPVAPCNVYGASKLAGEEVVRERMGDHGHVVRTSWLFGPRGQNFVKTIAELLRERPRVRVVADQHGTPTPATDLAHALWALAATPEAPSLLHYSARPEVSWFQFAEAIREQMLQLGWEGLGELVPCDSEEYSAAAPRPEWSVLAYSSFWESIARPRPEWGGRIAPCLPAPAAISGDPYHDS